MNEEERRQAEFMRENNCEANAGLTPIAPEFSLGEQELMKIQTNYLEGNSWHPTRIDAFKKVIEQTFILFPLENKISWDTRRGVDGQLCIELTVQTKNLGHLSTEVSIELLKSSNCPADLPDKLFEAFKVKFENKKQRLLKEWQKENGK